MPICFTNLIQVWLHKKHNWLLKSRHCKLALKFHLIGHAKILSISNHNATSKQHRLYRTRKERNKQRIQINQAVIRCTAAWIWGNVQYGQSFHQGSWLFTRLWSSSISWWLGSKERAARQSRSALEISPVCSWNAARRCKRWRSALNVIARVNSAIASFSLWLSIKTGQQFKENFKLDKSWFAEHRIHKGRIKLKKWNKGENTKW